MSPHGYGKFQQHCCVCREEIKIESSMKTRDCWGKEKLAQERGREELLGAGLVSALRM